MLAAVLLLLTTLPVSRGAQAAPSDPLAVPSATTHRTATEVPGPVRPISEEASTTGLTLATVRVGNGPLDAAVDPSNGWLYVANHDSNNVSVINGTAVVATVAVAIGPQGTIADPVNGFMYIVHASSWNVSVINGTTLLATIPVGAAPGGYTGQDGAAVDPANGWVYVINSGSANVSVINGTALVATIPVGATPLGVAMDPTNGCVYVGNHGSDNVSVIRGTSVVGSIALGGDPLSVAFDPVDGFVYVVATNFSSASGVVFRIAGTTVRSSIDVGEAPVGLAVDPVYGLVDVANMWSNTLSVLRGTASTEVATGRTPTAVSVDPANGYTFVTNWGSSNVSVFTGSQAVGSIPVGWLPCAVTFDPTNGLVYVVNQGSGTVSVLNGTAQYPTVVSFHASPSPVPRGSATTFVVNTTASLGVWRFAYSGLPTNCTSADTPNLTCTTTAVAGIYPVEVNASNSVGIYVVAKTWLIVLDANLTLFPVSLGELGLPTGVRWFAELGGLWGESTGPFITFYVPNGTYDYQVVPVSGYSPAPPSGVVTVVGQVVTVLVTFSAPRLYAVSFAETGLPAGSRWDVDLNGTTGASTTPAIAFALPNGTYSFQVIPPAGYQAVPSAGSVTIGGAGWFEVVAFQAVPTPLSANLSYQIESATCLADGNVTNFVLLAAQATGGTAPYAYEWSLPTGPATGLVTDTTTTWGENLTVTLTVSDAAGHTASTSAGLGMELPPCPPPLRTVAPPTPASSGGLSPEQVTIIGLSAALAITLAAALWLGLGRRGGAGGPSR